jgi:hypothetical protein
MNLPETAIEFLDAFRGTLSSPELRDIYQTTPMVHCYCFTREVNDTAKAENDIRKVQYEQVFELRICLIQYRREWKSDWDVPYNKTYRFILFGLLRLPKRCIVSASDCLQR